MTNGDDSVRSLLERSDSDRNARPPKKQSDSAVFVFSTLLGILVVSLSLAWNVALQSVAFELLTYWWTGRDCRALRSVDAGCDSAAAGIVTAIVTLLVLLGLGLRELVKCACGK